MPSAAREPRAAHKSCSPTAVITPSGDMMTQTIFAAPMVGLYFLSIVIAWVFGPKRLKTAE